VRSSPAPGPRAFGRGVIVAAGAPVPEAWREAPVVEVGEETLSDPLEVVARLRRAWLERLPVVVALAINPGRFRELWSIAAPPWSLDPGLDLPLERLHHAVWANNYDARAGEPIWWWSRKAESLGAGAGEEGDVLLPGGGHAWIDGGPRWSAPTPDLSVIHSESIELGRLDPVPVDPPGSKAELAPDQLAAVAHEGGPVRVIAPAGSGKTRVLTERVRHLLGDRGYDRDGVLAVAYNKEAQQELEQRLAELSPRTRTLNALGFDLLGRRRGSRPFVLNEPQVRELVETVFPIPRRRLTNTDPIGPYLDALGQVRLGLRDPAEVEAERDDVPGLAEHFESYRGALANRGAVDFDEQIYGAIEGLLREPDFREQAQRSHRHLLVDEFQDLTPAHVLLIRLLSMPAMDVFGVGDDDQTIYDHSGADPRFLVDYRGYFPDAGEQALEVNYRSAEPIVTAAATLLDYNRVRVEKQIRAVAGADRSPQAFAVKTHSSGESVAAVVDLVKGWTAEHVDPGEIAVLARVNSLLLGPQIALWSAGVPVRSRVGPELLERTGAAGALAWLRVATDPGGLLPADLEQIRRRPSRGFPGWISKWFGNCRNVSDLRRVAKRIDDERVAGKVDALADDIDMLADAAPGANTRQLLEAVRDVIGLGSAMEMLDGSKGTQAAASHLDDLEALIQVADLHPDPPSFEAWLRASLQESSAGGGSGGVTLSSVHRVKGREWRRVAVFGVTDGLMPHRLAEGWEAERRVLHVAITRGQERTVVLGDSSRRSPFLDELSGVAERPAEAPAVAPAAVKSRAAARPKAPLRGDPAPGAEAANQALRAWRSQRSSGDGVPAYVVLSNAQLDGIAHLMPADPAALLACDGIGPARLERYGDEILAVLDSARP